MRENLDTVIGIIHDRKYLKDFLGEEFLGKEEVGDYIMSKYNSYEFIASHGLTQMELNPNKDTFQKKLLL